MRWMLLVGAALALGGCASKQANILGKKPLDGKIELVSSVAPGGPVTVTGVMVEKCPVACCWFMLRDKSGVIRVDTKSSGFVVLDVPLNSNVKVTGTVKNVGEKMIAATGMSY
jgi:uncharacterized protein YdeI (BOF family)